ncbi:hypothetical protein CYMTET_49429 [Cymbomonas tetramitiformis]|uniref:Uncharacterized protein n=1 Tax=Cymbomonas tetramitiformis TaxID=36881 RepID=A0AAE0BRW1_9CHLO|nr:hypothetical protein CYMTET_49429 [Cymbomonas tetramitiformis]
MFRLRKHKLAGTVQDPIVLTSRAMLGAGLASNVNGWSWCRGDHHGCAVGDEKDTGYNTNVDWGAALRAISTVFDMNAGLPTESKQQDPGKADGEAIVFAMGAITALNLINQEALKNRLKVCGLLTCAHEHEHVQGSG